MKQAQATSPSASETLTARQQAIVPIAAFAAAGDIAQLNGALNQGLDAGMTVTDAKEILVQLYAYAGFPRSLNALGELMKVLEARKQRGVPDAPGSAPSRPIPKGDALLAAGTANQTSESARCCSGCCPTRPGSIAGPTAISCCISAREAREWREAISPITGWSPVCSTCGVTAHRRTC